MKSAVSQVERSMIVQIEPWVDDSELQQLMRVINSTFLVEHDLTREFESMTAKFTGARHAIAVCNGSMALFVCLRALGIGPGDEVIVPNFTFIASATSVILAGAMPVLCEVREDTFCIDLRQADGLVTDRTKAIMPVHLYGQSADMVEVLAFAKRHGLKVIEDAAEGIGVRFQGKHVGVFGNMGIISYYGNKTVTCGEGGVVLTNDDALAQSAYRLKNYGRDRKGTYVHETIGFNFSFTDLQAAIGISQMNKFDSIAKKKEEIHERYVEHLADLESFRPVFVDPRCEPVFWFTSFLCDQREELAAFLQNCNIQTRRFFCPLHQQPCFVDSGTVGVGNGEFPISESIYQRGISLPSSYNLTWDEQRFVIEQIRGFYAGRH